MKRQSRLRRWSILCTTMFQIALASVGLAACGANGSAQNQVPATQRQIQATQLPQQRQAQATQLPQQRQAQAQKCGAVFGYGILEAVPQDAGSLQAETCFWQAFQHCRPATLVFTSGGMGKGVTSKTATRTFALRKVNSTCVISDTRQEGTSPNSPATTYTCTGLIQHPRALDFIGCGRDGTIHVLGA